VKLRRSPLFATILACGLALLGASCGSAEPTASAPAAVESRPKDAADIARQLIGGKVGALVFVERVRGNAAATKFLQLGSVKELLEGTSFDPMNDIVRAYVTGPSASEKRAIVFAEHTLDAARIDVAVQDMLKKSDSPGVVLEKGPAWRIKVEKKGQSGVVAFIPPRFVVFVPEDLAAGIDRFASTGGLPGPTGSEAAKLYAIDPAVTLRAKGVPPVPPTITAIDADVFLRADGGVNIDATGQSSAEQAPKDAEQLTQSIGQATSIGIGIFRIPVFRPVVFTAAGDHVVTHHELTASEVETLMSIANAFIQ